MKKLFFSAVALIAFSSVSMANTIEIEEVNLKEERVVVNHCATVAAISMHIFEEEYHNHQVNQGIPANKIKCIDTFTYNAMYYAYLASCR